jgi:tRNA A37 threonylcarbamoyladenosine biosynthesis protein TsaE
MNVYPINQKSTTISQLVHIDTYRLKDEQDLVEIGAEDYLGKPNTVCLIEWPDKIEGLLQKYNKKNFIPVEIKQMEDSNEREIIWNLPN